MKFPKHYYVALELSEGNAEKAREYYLDALKISRRLAEILPNDVQAPRDLFCSYYRFGLLLKVEKDVVAARDCFLQALEPATRNFELAPGFVQFRQDLALIYRFLGEVEEEPGNVDEANAYYQKASAYERSGD